MSKTEHIVTCKNYGFTVDQLLLPEVNMGYIECPNCKKMVDQNGNAW